MCGIAGIFSPEGKPADSGLLVRMTTALRHRGPDDEGFLLAHTASAKVQPFRGSDTVPEITNPDINAPFRFDDSPNLALGWRRLGIIDLSPTGHQPMTNADRTVWIVFNGEIYNYIELRKELQAAGFVFRTQSDTEVILHAYTAWGPECVNRLNGMWGFALYDTKQRKLFCARDRFGIKPFYYWWDGTTLLFASEIKALLESREIPRVANGGMVYDYLAHRIIDHTDQTFFESIYQLRPGHWLQIDKSGLRTHQYYQLTYSPDAGTYDEAQCRRYVDEFRERFTDSIRLHLRTDATIGSCLSGGLDSSSIVCTGNQLIFGSEGVSRSIVGDRQKTFTATYADARFSEDQFVQSVIGQTHAAPFFIQPSSEGLRADLPAFVRAHDEPVISTSMYAQWNVMKLASQNKIKVLLDGQGGDELLGGYRWHFPVFHGQLMKELRFGDLLREISSTQGVTGLSMASLAKPILQKLAKSLVPKNLRSEFLGVSGYINSDFASRSANRATALTKSDFSLQRRLWEEETRFNLQQLLHYEDRNSMAFSIEARVPFVEYRLIEFVMNVPAVYKIHEGWSKYLLRRSMEGLLPKDIQWRRDKMGFVTPEELWMRELHGDFRTLLRQQPLRAGRFLLTEKFAHDFEQSTLPLASSDTWRFLNLELWMREFAVS
ncbi:MAG: asparagine synthase (glutamine-hydrolyzing) [Ignavibacteriales bacterium]|nr:asparagine synthase (glutamine-hydrolyzing) [Ignavibacteriales bacterium]